MAKTILRSCGGLTGSVDPVVGDVARPVVEQYGGVETAGADGRVEAATSSRVVDQLQLDTHSLTLLDIKDASH